MGSGGGNSGPTLQQQQLETQQAVTNANLNIEENSQRKAILNSLQGTRVFRGSALSRALTGNDPGVGGPSPTQLANSRAGPFSRGQTSLFDVGGGGAGAATPVATPAPASGGYVGGSLGGGARGGSGRGLPP